MSEYGLVELLRWPLAVFFCVAVAVSALLVMARWWIPPLSRLKYNELVAQHNELIRNHNELRDEVVYLKNWLNLSPAAKQKQVGS